MQKVYHSRILLASALLGCAIWLIALIMRNGLSLMEGFRYLIALRHWRPKAGERVQRAGPFASCYDLVRLNNLGRYQYILAQLQSLDLPYEEVPIPGEPLPNIFIRIGSSGPCTLLIAHYDLARETSSYQGASDNTAAVAVLLAALRDFSANKPQCALGILFSAAEEHGLLGSQAFLDYAQTQQLAIQAAINFDMLGRDRLAIRPSALPGFYFEIPLVGMLAYDGRHFQRAQAYQQPDTSLVQDLKALAGNNLIVYQRFTARSDSNIFQEAGIPTVAISSSNMFYLDHVWERDADRVELLDEHNLELARSLILAVGLHR